MLALFRGVGLAIAAVLCVRLLWTVYRGRLDPITGMAAGLGAVVLLGPVVHPWYVLWGLIPLAATRALPRYRRALLAASAVLAVVVPPTGADFNFRAFQLPLALVASLVMLAVLIWFQRMQVQGATGADIDALPGHAPLPHD